MFNYDSGLMRGLSKIADLVILNLLTILCCIPIVTIGASLTAAHYAALKICRDENYVVKNFFKSFKENLLQSTIIWVLWVVLVVLTAVAWVSYPTDGIGMVIKIVLSSMMVFIAMTTMWIFPMQSKFINPILTTVKNAFWFSCRYIIRTLGMLAVTVVFVVIPLVLTIQWYWIPLLFGISVPIYLCAMMYNKVFEKLEDKILGREEMEEEE